MIKTGEVKSIQNNKIFISVFRESSCSHCSKCSDSQKVIKTIEISSDLPLSIGDIVTFEIEDNKIIKLASIIYFFPILLMILSYYLGIYFFKKEWLAISFSFLSLIFSFLFNYFYDKKTRIEHDIKIVSFKKGEDSNEV